MNLSKGVKTTRVMNAVAAGVSDQNSSSVNMANFESVLFVAALGTLTAGQVTNMKAQQSDDDGVSDAWSDLLGTLTAAMDDGDSDKLIQLDIVKPRKQYVRAVLVRATQNAVIDGIVAYQYGPLKLPTTHDSSVQDTETHVSPAEGTA